MMADVTEHQSPAETALDLFVYAPLGLLTEATTRLPELAEKGRVQVGNAKMLGRFAVQLGRQQAETRLGRVHDDARQLLVTWGLAPPDVPDQPEPAPTRAAARARTRAAETATPAAPSPADPGTVPPVESLGIPDYDSLAASQVVARLAGLPASELDDVRRYEEAHRARKTILGRIAQLRA